MPATPYKIWAVGPPVGQGATNSFHVGVASIAKGNGTTSPFVVANELICSQLARALLLPIPPGFIVNHNGQPHFVSLNFNLSGHGLPPADPSAIVSSLPQIASGIILFDIWLLNGDRHRQNLAYDSTINRVEIFDHSHAFLGPNGGRARLESRENEIGIGGHCLAREMLDFSYIIDWNKKVLALPEFYIKEVVSSANVVGLPVDDISFCSDYLLRRRNKLLDLMRANRPAFPKVQATLWDQLNPMPGGVI
jgi:hypothetical protein